MSEVGTTSKHTPPPWRADDNPFNAEGYSVIIRAGESSWVAEVFDVDDLVSRPEAEANACLIAAAPALLAALIAIRDIPTPFRSSASVALRMRAMAAKAVAEASR